MTGIAHTEVEKYLRDAQTLRRTMRINREDSAAGRRKGGREYRYFVDANVVAAYANPSSKQAYFRPLSDWLESDPDLKLATNTLMAEFMFSGRLPGQRAGRLYMTPAHYEELHNMARGIANRVVAELQKDPIWLDDPAFVELAARIKAYNQGVLPADEMAAFLNTRLPNILSPIILSALTELGMLFELLRESRVVRADTEKWFDRAIMHPSEASIRNWTIAIRAARRRRGVIKEQNLVADALSVAQLMQLQNQNSSVNYVLISADSSIEVAYAGYFPASMHAGSKPRVFSLRHPRDYIPLINLRSISEAAEGADEGKEILEMRKDMFDKIERALDDLLIGIPNSAAASPPNNSNVSGNGIERALAFRGLAESLPPPEIDHKERIDALRDLWVQASSEAVTINAGVLLQRMLSGLKPLMDVLTEQDVVAAALGQLEDTVRDLTARHILAPLLGIVEQYRQRAKERQPDGLYARRAPLRIRLNIFRKLINDIDINDYLDEFIAGRAVIPFDKLISNNSEDEVIALLFGACIAVAAEDWKSARSFAVRAQARVGSITRDPLGIRSEVEYCLALVLRFDMHNQNDYKTAYSLLDGCARRHHAAKQTFRELRAESEAAALSGVFLFKLHLIPGFARLSLSEEQDILDRTHAHIERAQEVIRQRAAQRPRADAAASVQIQLRTELQVYANSICLALYDLWIVQIPEASMMAYLREQRAGLRARVDRWKSVMDPSGHPQRMPTSVAVLAKIADVILTPPGDARRQEARDARILLDQLLAGDLVDFDQEEYRFFRNHLNEMVDS